MNAKMKDWDQESEDSEQEEELNFSSEEEVEEEYEWSFQLVVCCMCLRLVDVYLNYHLQWETTELNYNIFAIEFFCGSIFVNIYAT